MYEWLLLCLLAALAGAVNAVAGGGTLLTFPALFAALGYSDNSAVVANATSTVALFPGALAALGGYRRELAQCRSWAVLLALPSLVGGLLGSVIVLLRPDVFKTLVPWLILAAAVLFSLQPHIARWTGIGQRHATSPAHKAAAVVFQFLVALYGGYFGAGIGILMLATLAMMGMSDIHEMNALKTLLNLLINGVAVAVFAFQDVVHWPYATAMAFAAVLGGYTAARTARKLDRRIVRATVIVIGYGLAIYYFYLQLRAASG